MASYKAVTNSGELHIMRWLYIGTMVKSRGRGGFVPCDAIGAIIHSDYMDISVEWRQYGHITYAIEKFDYYNTIMSVGEILDIR